MSQTDDDTAARLARLIGRVEAIARKAREAGLVVLASELTEAATEAKAEPQQEQPR
jgi:DNA-binding FrmR family transcriptional regulator